MSFASEPFSGAPLSAVETTSSVVYSATSVAPLFRHGSHVGKINILYAASAVSPLLKYGSHTSSIHWTPRDATGRAMPVYPFIKFGVPEQVLPLVANSIGPLLRLARHKAVLDKKTVLSNTIGPLLTFGTPTALFVEHYPAASIASLLKFGTHSGKVGTTGQVDSVGVLLKFGTPSGPYRHRAKTIHVLTVQQVVYASRRKVE